MYAAFEELLMWSLLYIFMLCMQGFNAHIYMCVCVRTHKSVRTKQGVDTGS